MMFRDRRRVRAVLMSAVAALVVVGCGDDDSAESPTETTGSADGSAAATDPPSSTETTADASTDVEPVTITYLASQNWVLDSERELAEQFEAETGIHVDYQIIPADQYFSVLQTKLEAGGEGIDIFGGQSGKTDIQLQLGVEENAVPVTDEEWVQRMDPVVDRADQPRRHRVRPDDLGHGRRFVGRRVQQDDLRRQRHRGADDLRRVRRRLPDAVERRCHADLRAGLGRMASRAVVR